jgi:arginase family enzyme
VRQDNLCIRLKAEHDPSFDQTHLYNLVQVNQIIFLAFVIAQDHHHDGQLPLGYVKYPYEAIYPGDGEVTADAIFSGVTTFARLPWVQCLTKEKDTLFDIAFIGAPFDTGTSYRPGARFGPSGIRAGSRRLTLYGGYNVPLEVNPFRSGLKIIDCGDIPVTPYDNNYAIQQIEDGHKSLLQREALSPLGNDSATGQTLTPLSIDGKLHPRIITLGGDHTIVLPILRSIYSVYGSISVIHFDSHLDTWKPSVFGGAPSLQAAINHGTYFYWASQEGLIKNGSSIASIRILFLTLFLFLRSDRFDPSLAFDSTVPLGQHCLAHLTIRMTMPPDFRELKPVKSTQLVPMASSRKSATLLETYLSTCPLI